MTNYDVMECYATVLREIPRNDTVQRRNDPDMENDTDRATITATFLDGTKRIQLYKMEAFFNHNGIQKYTMITNCAFVKYDGSAILAVELRDERNRDEDAVIVIAQVGIDGREMRMGFIVSEFAEFFAHVQ